MSIRTSSPVSFIDGIIGNPNMDAGLADRLTELRSYLARPADESRPFLSVLLRTQGKRIEPLKDALLCLYGQTDQDFEVIIIDHDASVSSVEVIRNVIDEYPASFRNRVQLIRVEGGSRSRPLNTGVEAARGRYISVFDDDDLLFANWVEAFHKEEKASAGRLLRANVATQRVKPESWPQDQDGFLSLSWPNAEYARHFIQTRHMVVNHSPFMSWAFPSSLFAEWGFRFDEDLTVCEDWDMILRGSLLLGVDDVPYLTAIYRRWEGAESSYTQHDRESWLWSEARVIEKLNESTWFGQPGMIADIREIQAPPVDEGPNPLIEQNNDLHRELYDMRNTRSWRYTYPMRWGIVKAKGAVRRARRLFR